MIIGFDAKRAFKNNTGLGNYSRMVVCALADARPDIELVLFTPDARGSHAGFYERESVGSQGATGSCSKRNVKVVTPRGVWRLFPSLWRSFGIAAEIRRRHVDLYHGLSHELPHGRVGACKLVVSMHDLIVWRYPKHFPVVDRLIYKMKQCRACRCADAIVAISRQTQRDLVDLLNVDGAKIHVVYQSCDAIFRAAVPYSRRAAVRQRYALPDKYIVCVGTIEMRKNQVAVVEAMAMVASDVHLVVIGKKTAYYDAVVDAVSRHGLESRVHFLHSVDFADFPAIYAEAVASVYMSIFEGFGIPVLESLVCGTPVVASSRSSIPEVGGDAALYADPASPDEVAGQINRLLCDPHLYSELQSLATIQASRFEPKKIASDMLRLYMLTIGRKG